MTNVDQITALLDNPDGAEVNMDDPKVLAAINALSGDTGDEAEEGAPAPDTTQEPAATQQASEPAKADEPAKVILSKDGKHQIPFDVLEQSRANEEAAIAAAKQLAAVVQALEGEIARGKAAPEGETKPPQVHPLREKLDAARAAAEKLGEEYPDLAPAQKALLESITTMGESLFGELRRQREITDRLEQHASQTVQERASAQKETAKDALSQVPALVVWQAKNPELFKLASTFDDTLKADKAWQGKPMAERFQKAVEMVVAVRGPSVLDGITPVQTQQGSKPKEAVATAQERIAAALGIASLSDLPGGTAVAQDAAGSLDQLSDSQLTEKLGGMTEQQILAFMAGAVT